MVTFRCTAAFQRKLHIYPAGDGPTSSTALGDWYCHLLFTGRVRFVVCVSELSRLPVIVAARELDSFVPRFQDSLREVLQEIGIPAAAIEKEISETKEISYARTRNRRVLGTINDFFVHLHWALNDRPAFSPLDHALYLSRIPVGPYPNYTYPADEARRLMGGEVVGPFPKQIEPSSTGD